MHIDIKGAPVCLGIREYGTDLGPAAIRYSGLYKEIELLKHSYTDYGDVEVDKVDVKSIDDELLIDKLNDVNAQLYNFVGSSISKGNLPLVLGGDHSISIGTVLGANKAKGGIGVLWVDAHCDCNTLKTSQSGHIHGMPLATATGYEASRLVPFKKEDEPFVDPSKCAIIGNREVDELELEVVKELGIKVFTMADVDMIGIKGVMDQALEIVTNGTNGYHLSFDMDAITPEEAPGVGTPIRGGFTFREAHLIVELVSETPGLCSFEFAETNPLLDIKNRTGKLANSLIAAVLGKRFTAPVSRS